MSHVLQTLTDLDPTATILSLDGVGAFDPISRNAMLKGLLTMEGGERVLPFYGDPSTFLWEDDLGGAHSLKEKAGSKEIAHVFHSRAGTPGICGTGVVLLYCMVLRGRIFTSEL